MKPDIRAGVSCAHAGDLLGAPPIEVVLLGSVVFAVVAAVALGSKTARLPALGCVLSALGLALLGIRAVAGSLSELYPQLQLSAIAIENRHPMGWLIDGFGLLTASVGVAILSRKAVLEKRAARLAATLAGTAAELESTRGLLDSVMRSALGATLVLRMKHTDENAAPKLVIKLVNGSVEQLFGAPRRSLLGETLEDATPEYLREWLSAVALRTLANGGPFREERRCEGGPKGDWYEIVAVRHADGVTITIGDITDRKRVEDALRRAAYADPLTGLSNRAALKQSLSDAVHRARRNEGYGFALLFLDFDRFKQVNDTLGHDVGDELIKSIADRLRVASRRVPSPGAGLPEHIVCRLGGDEFVLLLSGVGDRERAEELSGALVEEFAEPHKLSGHEVVSTASIGLVVCDGQYVSAADTLRDADLAMYEAKAGGKARYMLYDPAMRAGVENGARLEEALRSAIETHAIQPEFQPIVDLTSGEIQAFEVLARWHHPEYGQIAPDEFIPLAEEIGIIHRIGEQMLYRACEAIKRLNGASDGRRVAIQVNHSKHELLCGSFVPLVKRIIEETGADPSLLRVEITESLCVAHRDEISRVLDELGEIGVGAAIDDFGTGDSSFAAFERFPVRSLKIDRCFLQSERDGRQRAAIVRAMVELAHNLDTVVTVEGIETMDDLAMLQSLDCDAGQGWLLGDAMPLDEAERAVTLGYAGWVRDGALLERLRVKKSDAERLANSLGARNAA